VRRRLEVLEGAARVDDVAAGLRERAERASWLTGRPSARDLGRLERLEAGRAILVETGELADSRLPAGRWWTLRPDGTVAELGEDEQAVVAAVVFAWQAEDFWERQAGRAGRPRRGPARGRRPGRLPAG